MNAVRCLVLAATAALAGCRCASVPNDPPTPPADEPTTFLAPEAFGDDWKRAEPTRRFESADLFNHIDGAAELFLELGFRRVSVDHYRRGDDELCFELYEMASPTSARALYCHLRGRGQPAADVAGRHVANRYQIIMQKSRFFVQLSNVSGNDVCAAAMATLANRAWNALPDDAPIDLLKRLPEADRVADSEAIIRGPYGLKALYMLGAGDMLLLKGETFAVAADYRTSDDDTCTRIIAPYADAPAAQAAFKHLNENLDPYLEVLQREDGLLVFRDYREEYGTARLVGDVLELCVRMTTPPAGVE